MDKTEYDKWFALMDEEKQKKVNRYRFNDDKKRTVAGEMLVKQALSDDIVIEIGDNGKPYNPLDAKEPDITASAEERTIGGLGIFMVRKMMDNVEYMYKDGQNVLTLTMKV